MKLTPEDVEQMEAAINEAHAHGDDEVASFADNLLGMNDDALDTILTLCREWRARGRLLQELHAQVWGECPSLLNEDSGGDAKLDLDIRAALKEADHD